MKSLMEEASSVSKAIEKGWTNAGKPKEFTIKVYEEAEKNFIGMTTKPAKIGIFFAEPKKKVEQRPRKAKVEQPKPKRAPQETKPREEKAAPKEDLGPIWGDDMVASAKEWLGDILTFMGLGDKPYSVEQQRFHLKITFSKGVLPDKEKQKHLFAIFSGLLLTMLKRQYKRPLRGYKIVLTEGG